MSFILNYKTVTLLNEFNTIWTKTLFWYFFLRHYSSPKSCDINPDTCQNNRTGKQQQPSATFWL